MKKTFLRLMLPAAALALGFTACSDDDTLPQEQNQEETQTFAATRLGSVELPGGYDANLLPTDPLFVGPSEYHAVELSTPKLQGIPTSIPDLIEWVAERIMLSAYSSGTSEIMKIFGEDSNQQMNQLVQQVEELNNKMKELMTMFENRAYEEAITKRYTDYVSPLQIYTRETFEELKNCDQPNDSIVRGILSKWANNVTKGDKPLYLTEQFINYLVNVTSLNLNMYKVYDTYVYNTVPWEHQGYEFREAMRANDMAVIGQNMTLAAMYNSLRDDISEATRQSNAKDMTDFMNKFKTFYEENPVERHEDKRICQIDGMHIVLSPNTLQRDYQNHPWFPNGSYWEKENSESAWVVEWGDMTYNCGQMYDFALSADEVKILKNYYDKNPDVNSMYDVLTQEANLNLGYTDSELQDCNLMMVCQSQCNTDHDSYNDYFLVPQSVCQVKSSFDTGKAALGSAYLNHWGNLFLKTVFERWASYDTNNRWFTTMVTARE